MRGIAPTLHRYAGRCPPRGFAAIAAIFLVVVLAALGGFMVTFSNTQQRTAGQDVLGMRAYWAARAGLEWGITSAVATSACPASATTLTVDTFSVVVNCLSTSYTEAATIKVMQFTAVASVGVVGGVGFIERSLSASVER